MDKQPTIQNQAKFYDAWNEKHRMQSYDGIEEESKARGKGVLLLLDSLRIKNPRILEVGCGTGWFTEKLIQYGLTTAIDLSPRAIEIAVNRGLDARFIAGDFCARDFPYEQFDVAVCLETISAVPDQPGFVEKLAAVTRPGGYLIITAQNKFVYDRRGDIGPPQPGNIRKWLTGKQLRGLLYGHFHVLKTITVLPKGNKGILRLVNSYKLTWLLECIFSRAVIDWPKEKLGLGHTRVVLAQRRNL
jgi:SAM-dependent methyltransferase